MRIQEYSINGVKYNIDSTNGGTYTYSTNIDGVYPSRGK